VRLVGSTPGGRRASLTRLPHRAFWTYDAAVSISDELARARQLTYAADETSARDLLLSLIPQIEQEDRDDLMLEVLAQLGEIYLARGANDGVHESIQRIDDCLAIYTENGADANAQMICRYSRRAHFLRTGLAAAQGDHDGAAAALAKLNDGTSDGDFADLADEHAYLRTRAHVLCATALCDDDLHARSLPLWEQVLDAVDQSRDGGEFTDHLLVTAATAYGRFCVQTGRLSEAEPWLRRAGARAQQSGWELATAITQLERAAACWSVGDHASTEELVSQAHPVIARHARAHDLARCWLYLGFTRLASGALEAADECWEHAEQQWRDLGKPLQLHRILLQRSWISIFWSRFGDAVELIAQARELLDSSPRSSWLQYAQLDNQLGTVWRADALADLGFDSSGDPDETLEETEARQAEGLGILRGEVGTPEYWRGLTKLEQAAELKIPAALAVDSVRYSIADADARSRWATRISAPILAGAFAVAWEWENTQLISELVEYHSARGTFNAEPQRSPVGEWASTATAPVLIDTEEALSAAGPSPQGAGSLTRLGPLPPLQMQPDAAPIMSHYRALALQRYGRDVTASEPAWSTWP
jgi:tetratricopeptide (TPR) repeat protein